MAVAYNLPGLNCVLRLSPAAVSGIYLGDITNWTDPKIKQSNGTCNLPDEKITPVYRSDNSGSTYAFTDYLSNVNATWKSKFGTGVNAQWPAGVGARGSSGVAGVVTKTPGAVTYVDVAYTLQNKLRAALVQNRAGKFANAGLRGIQAAAAGLPAKITSSTQLKLVDPPKSAGPLAYPISTFTYVIAPTSSGKAKELRNFIYWAVTRGQTYGKPLLFQQLPVQVQAYAYREIKKIQSAA
jgi:phosphate transport system substrate-binding protein